MDISVLHPDNDERLYLAPEIRKHYGMVAYKMRSKELPLTTSPCLDGKKSNLF
jgi:hypothetical protein